VTATDLSGALPTQVEALLLEIATQEGTGSLTLTHVDGDEAVVWFREGCIYSVSAPGRRALLGARLMSSGAIAPEALGEALEIQRTELQGWRLGELLVHLGYVERDVVESFVAEQLRDILDDLIAWPIGASKFRNGKKTRQDVAQPSEVAALLQEIRDRRARWDRMLDVIGDIEAVPHLSSGASADSVELDPHDWAMLCKIDGHRSVTDLADECGFTLLEAGQFVASLVDAGLVDMDGERAAASAPERDASDGVVVELALRRAGSAATVSTDADDDLARSVASVTAALEGLFGDDAPATAKGAVVVDAPDSDSHDVAQDDVAHNEDQHDAADAADDVENVAAADEPDEVTDEAEVDGVDASPHADDAEDVTAAATEDADGATDSDSASDDDGRSAEVVTQSATVPTVKPKTPSADLASLIAQQAKDAARRRAAERAERDAAARAERAATEAAEQAAAEEAARLAEEAARLAAETQARMEAEEAAAREAAEAAAVAAERVAAEAIAWDEHRAFLDQERAEVAPAAWAEHVIHLDRERQRVEVEAWTVHAAFLDGARQGDEPYAWADHAAFLDGERRGAEEQAWADHADVLAVERDEAAVDAWSEHAVWQEAERVAAEATAWADHRAWLEGERAAVEAEAWDLNAQFDAILQAELDRIAAEEAAAEAARIEAERIEAERIEAERIAAEQAKAEAERLAAEEAAAEAARIEAERVEAERIAAEHAKAEAERLAAEEAAAEAARLEAERAEAERLAAEAAAAQQAEAEAKAAAEKRAAEQAAAETARADAKRQAAEQLAAEQAAAAAEAVRLEAERAAAEAAALAEQQLADPVPAQAPLRAEMSSLLTELNREAESLATVADEGPVAAEVEAPEPVPAMAASTTANAAATATEPSIDSSALMRELSSLSGLYDEVAEPTDTAPKAPPVVTRPVGSAAADKQKKKRGLFGR
jgi:hypothetical protein